jgi:hypothetical protein
MLKSNIHPKIVSERLGHSRVALTMDTYSHVIPGMQEGAAAAINAARKAIYATPMVILTMGADAARL